MNIDEILHTPSMPLVSPSYPRGPFRFVDREYMIVAYESDAAAIRQAVPEPLVPVPDAIVYYEWIRMPDSSGFGDYTESGVVIPCTWRGTPCNFTAQMLAYAGETVAIGTMAYKHEAQVCDIEKTVAALSKLQVNLKLIPDVDGTPAIAQLVGYNLTEIKVKGSWTGPARLHLIPHVNAPVADLAVRRIVGGRHFIADLTLPYGRVLHDYLRPR